MELSTGGNVDRVKKIRE